MPRFDYSAWITRAQAFIHNLAGAAEAKVHSSVAAPPASDEDVVAVERALGATLPSSLREFFTRGSAGLDYSYTFEPSNELLDRLREILPDQRRIYGGARVGPLSDLPDLSRSTSQWASETWIAEEDAQRAIWESARPFLLLDNGDYLALDIGSDQAEPPVVYLKHDDESVAIAPGLDEFLRAWEGLCYLGPEHWLLLEFVSRGGYLDANSDHAARLRGLFGR